MIKKNFFFFFFFLQIIIKQHNNITNLKIFSPCLLSAATLSLSLGDFNREFLVKSSVLELLLTILRRFKELEPPVTGPKAANAKFPWEAAFNPNAATPEDVETVEHTIGALAGWLAGIYIDR